MYKIKIIKNTPGLEIRFLLNNKNNNKFEHHVDEQVKFCFLIMSKRTILQIPSTRGHILVLTGLTQGYLY